MRYLDKRSFIVKVIVLIIACFMLAACGATNLKQENASVPAKLSQQNGRIGKADSTKIIQTANLELETAVLPEAEKKIMKIINDQQGQIGSMAVTRDGKGQLRGRYTLRVPQEKLNTVVETIAGLSGITVRQRSISQRDVTEQYIDLEARLDNMKRHEKRLHDILGRAATVEEILKVENELSRVRGQIESQTARFRNLSNQVELATLTISISEAADKYWSTFGRRIASTLQESIMLAGDVFLGLIMIAVGGIPVIAAAILIWWLWRKYKRKKSQTL